MSGSSPSTLVYSLFTAADLVALRRDRLCTMAASYFPDEELTDAYLLEQLQAAEAELQHEMRIYFTPRIVVPELATPDMVATAQAAQPTWPIIREPGYDYDPKLFNGESWGLIQVRQKPIISITSITFNYPGPNDVAYAVPTEWIRPDFKYGIINLVPVQVNSSLPLNAYLLSVLGGGSMAPFLMQISYACGLQNARQDYPDLVNIIKRLAVCQILEDRFLPQSGSTSGDGLSQSLSVDCNKYRENVEKRVSSLRDQMHGVRMIVC